MRNKQQKESEKLNFEDRCKVCPHPLIVMVSRAKLTRIISFPTLEMSVNNLKLSTLFGSSLNSLSFDSRVHLIFFCD